jgi:hypothetical protein
LLVLAVKSIALHLPRQNSRDNQILLMQADLTPCQRLV